MSKMIKFVESYEESINQLPHQKDIRLIFQIKSSYCMKAPDKQNQATAFTTFILNNLEWKLTIATYCGRISINLECLSKTPEKWQSAIYCKFAIINLDTMQREGLEFPAEYFMTRGYQSKYILNDYIVNTKFLRSETVTIELCINIHAEPRSILDTNTFLKWYAKFRELIDVHKEEFDELKIANEDLRIKLLFYEEDKQNLEMFKHVLRLFEIGRCDRFEHAIELENNVKVHVQMDVNDGQTDEPRSILVKERNELKAQLAKSNEQLKSIKAEYLKSIESDDNPRGALVKERDELKAEVAKLKQQLKRIEAEHLKDIDVEQTKSIKSEQSKSVKSEQSKSIKSEPLKRTEAEQLKNIAAEQSKSIKSEQSKSAKSEQSKSIKSEPLKRIEAEQLKDIEAEQSKSVKSEQSKSVKSEHPKSIKSEPFKVIDAEQLKDIEAEQSKNIESEQSKSIKSEQLKDLEAEQLNDLEAEQSKSIESEQSKSVKSEQSKSIKSVQSKNVNSED